MDSCLFAVDDVDEGRLQAGTTDQEPIDIGLLRQLSSVLLRNAATIEDPSLLSCLRGDRLLQPLADSSVDFLCLLGCCDFASADSPVSLSDERMVHVAFTYHMGS